MASHDLALRGRVPVNPDVTLAQVWDAICDLAEAFSIELDRMPDTAYGAIELVDLDNVVMLDEPGSLFLSLSISGFGHGTWPDAALEMLSRLDKLSDEGGAIELIDTDISATNDDESKSARFVGSTLHAKRLAQVKYGLEQAKEWLTPIIGKAGFESVAKAASAEVELTAKA